MSHFGGQYATFWQWLNIRLRIKRLTPKFLTGVHPWPRPECPKHILLLPILKYCHSIILLLVGRTKAGRKGFIRLY
jgi:hypothetical protein